MDRPCPNDSKNINLKFLNNINVILSIFKQSNNKRSTQDTKKSIPKEIKHLCYHCDYKAARKGDLKKHTMTVHEGIVIIVITKLLNKYTLRDLKCQFMKKQKYQCDPCDYKATTQGSIKRHHKSVHEGINYLCDQCDDKATKKNNLKKHEM